MNGIPSLLSNDLQRGFQAGLMQPVRMADGGINEAESEGYEFVYDPETMTYTRVLKKTEAPQEKKADVQGDASPGFAPPQGKPSGKGFLADMQALGKGLAGLVDKGGIIGAIGRGLADAFGGGKGLAGLFGGTTGGPAAAAADSLSSLGITGGATSVGGVSLGGVDTSGGFDAAGMDGAGQGISGMAGNTGSADAPWKTGGFVRAAKGMSMEDNSFIIPADVTAAMGNGSSQAGLRALQQHISPDIQMIRGNGDGMSDSIPANIAGTQPALISDGEAYVPPGVVQAMGGGNMSKGASNLYAMMDEARSQAHGKKKQQRQVNPQKIISKVART